MVAGLFAGALVIGIVVWATFAYHRIVHFRELAGSYWTQIDTQLKTRWGLIPSLVNLVRTHTTTEEGRLQSIESALDESVKAPGPESIAEAEEVLTQALFSLLADVDEHPELTNVAAFQEMLRTLADAEDAIQHARKYYNVVVRDMNDAISTFPRSAVAAIFGFGAFELFASEEEIRREMKTVIL